MIKSYKALIRSVKHEIAKNHRFGITFVQKKCEIDFLGTQRVSAGNAEKMNCIFSSGEQNFYQNNVLSFIGINASGKTSVLKLITFVCGLLNNEAINNIPCREILEGLDNVNESTFDIFFFANNNSVNLLHTVIVNTNGKFCIKDEYLKTKTVTKIKSKADVLNSDSCQTIITRKNDEEFLLDDVSIMVAFNKRNKEKITVSDMLQYTNINKLSISEDCPAELIAFFDPSIEYLHINKTGKETDIRLKFKNSSEIILNQAEELNGYLSSGTISSNAHLLDKKTIADKVARIILNEVDKKS